VIALAGACDGLIEELLDEAEVARRRRPDLGPTAYEIDAPMRGAPRPDPEIEGARFLAWLAAERQGGPAALLPLGRGELKDLLLRWAAGHEAVRAVRDRRIDEVLSSISADDRRRHLRQLVALAAAAGSAENGGPPAVYVFGVEDVERTSLSQAEVNQLVPPAAAARMVSTADSRRIFCIGVAG